MRPTYSLWFYLGFWKNYAGKGIAVWRFPDFIKEKIWKNEYFLIDTFITPFFKLIGCKIVGHKIKLRDSCDGHGPGFFCTRCYTYPMRIKIERLPLKLMPLYVNDIDKKVVETAVIRMRVAK
jgi:hypothetical protein